MFGKWALKVPYAKTWRTFLNGLLGNMQEAEFSTTGWPELCPVVASIPGGFAVVMRRARPLNDDEWEGLDHKSWADKGEYLIPVEGKRSSFGIFQGRIVAVDYGS